MPSAKFVIKTRINNSFKNEKVKGMFDIEKDFIENDFNVNIPIENENWNIGLIVGGSGTGKTTIAKKVLSDFYFFEKFDFDNSKSILDNFSNEYTPKQITEVLSKVGFSSPPDWLKPFNVLSNGQKMRVELAKLILEEKRPFIYDEFTSVVDRQVAQVGSYAIQKFIRAENKKFIALSPHYDIIEWLEPDWIYDTNKMEFQFTKGLLRRPNIEINIRKAHQEEWKIFNKYHYLSHEHNNAAHKYIAEINSKPIAWVSVLHFPHPKAKNIKKIHRIVVLPDYQGIGIGIKVLNEISKIYKEQKNRISLVTSSPSLIFGLNKNKNWIMTRKPSRTSGGQAETSQLKKSISINRLTASFEYIGDYNG